MFCRASLTPLIISTQGTCHNVGHLVRNAAFAPSILPPALPYHPNHKADLANPEFTQKHDEFSIWICRATPGTIMDGLVNKTYRTNAAMLLT